MMIARTNSLLGMCSFLQALRPQQAVGAFGCDRGGRGVALLGAVLAAFPCALGAQALEPLVSTYVTLSSDYRHRGLSETRGQPSLQVGGDLQLANGFFAGVWANRIEYSAGPEHAGSAQLKVGYYAGYSRRIARWSLAAGASRYTYPGSVYDYDYNELTATAGYRDRLFLTASHIDDLFGRGASAFHGELGAVLPLPSGLELGATLGRLDSSDAGLDYTHWNIGLSKTFAQRVGVDLRYYDGSRYYSNPIATTAGDTWVLSTSYAFPAR